MNKNLAIFLFIYSFIHENSKFTKILIHVFMEKMLIHEMNIHLFMSENRDFGYPCVMYGSTKQ